MKNVMPGAALLLASALAHATLPPPTPQQAAAAAAKKAQADAQAQQDKAALLQSMDAVSARWRARAAKEGWSTHPPVAVAAPAAAVTAPATPARPAAPVPVRSEKLGTAPASEDVKARPTQPVPRGTPPTVNKPKREMQ
ncbi:hypothetical protein [Massilia sp. YMA4]|uniref:hypothetical protein n=1 Tax=Massilia sp. YMA4 TaxID=1593482 RepID=UPI000DD14F18|nr:hypothetical protein [Massilia sp. YMA4]AXA91543.1 hypothetical protein DPH57_10505 [Massilia sp. YMA4]